MGKGKTRVFFDGACPLCQREISYYKRQRGADGFDWIDLSQQSGGEVAAGLSCAAALQRFHVQTPDGDLLDGIDAFARLWAGLPRFRWLGWLSTRTPGRQIGGFLYDRFLPIRPHLQRFLFPSQAKAKAT